MTHYSLTPDAEKTIRRIRSAFRRVCRAKIASSAHDVLGKTYDLCHGVDTTLILVALTGNLTADEYHKLYEAGLATYDTES